jgi:O-acetyl-ADP-ribose deacetylase (regulator of RNase III)
MTIKYVTGDTLEPQGDGNKIIAHICNNKGRWGRGFVVALSNKWELPEKSYRHWAKGADDMPDFTLGMTQLVQVEDDTYVCNMIGQHDTKPYGNIPPIRYDRVRQCLNKLATHAKQQEASVHIPRIGCGLAGGTWQVIEGLIKETLLAQDVEVVVYTLEGDTSWR